MSVHMRAFMITNEFMTQIEIADVMQLITNLVYLFKTSKNVKKMLATIQACAVFTVTQLGGIAPVRLVKANNLVTL